MDKDILLKAFSDFLEGLNKTNSGSLTGSYVESEAEVVKSLLEEERRALFVVLEPQEGDMTTDLHGDTYTAAVVEKACNNFNKHCMKANLFHMVDTESAIIEQSFTTLSDFTTEEYGLVKKGTWLMWFQFPEGNEESEDIWKAVKAGEINGVSVGARAHWQEVDVTKSAEVKAVRRLEDFNFDFSGAHVALVGKHQGGPANGRTTLLTKSTEKLPTVDQVANSDLIQKALEQVQVKMSMEEFLTKFFDMWHSDAEMLTKLLGFETEYEAMMSAESEPTTHKDFLEDKISRISLMKSMSEGSLECISEEDYLSIIKYQKTFETNGETMSQVDMVKKSLLDEAEGQVAILTKSLTEATSRLEAAEAEIETFKSREAEAKKSARMEVLKSKGLVGEEADKMFEDTANLSDEAFAGITKMFGPKVDEELLVEKGVDAEAKTADGVDDSLLNLIKSNKAAKKGV